MPPLGSTRFLYVVDCQAIARQHYLLVCEEGDGLLDGQGVFYAEYAAAAALEAVQMGSAAERFTEVAGECTYISAFAAGHPYLGAWKPEGRVVCHIDSA